MGTATTQEKPSTSGYINIQNDPLEVLPVVVEDEAPTPPCVESVKPANKETKALKKDSGAQFAAVKVSKNSKALNLDSTGYTSIIILLIILVLIDFHFCHQLINPGTQISTKKKMPVNNGSQCNIADLSPLKLLTKGLDENTADETPEERLLQADDVEPFEDVAVDDEDYNPSLESEEDE